MPANPEAIAWYLRRSEDLLDDLRERIQSLRTRGGQLAGFSGAVLALVGANIPSIVGSLHGTGRGGAGAFLLVGVILLTASLVTALGGTLAPGLLSDISAEEICNYRSQRFTHEPELWRVHVRTLGAVLATIERTSVQGDEVAWVVRKAEYLFLSGLFSVAIALATLIVVMTL